MSAAKTAGEEEGKPFWRLTITKITEQLNRDVQESKKFTTLQVGRFVTKLGLKRGKIKYRKEVDGVSIRDESAIRYDRDGLVKLFNVFGLFIPPEFTVSTVPNALNNTESDTCVGTVEEFDQNDSDQLSPQKLLTLKVLEKVAKDFILNNTRNATSVRKNQIIYKLRNYEHQTTEPLTLKSFCGFNRIPLQKIYQYGDWSRLLAEANKIDDFSDTNEKEIVRAIANKWLSCNSYSYFSFILSLAENNYNSCRERTFKAFWGATA